MKVDLPEPDGPITATNSPDTMSRLTPRSAWTWCSPRRYVFARSRTSMSAVPAGKVIGLEEAEPRPTRGSGRPARGASRCPDKDLLARLEIAGDHFGVASI